MKWLTCTRCLTALSTSRFRCGVRVCVCVCVFVSCCHIRAIQQEHGVAYGDKEASDMRAKASFPLPSTTDEFSVHFSNQPVEMWGINFAGTVRVCHKSGGERLIYLPGTRTYDPAGITGLLDEVCSATGYKPPPIFLFLLLLPFFPYLQVILMLVRGSAQVVLARSWQ